MSRLCQLIINFTLKVTVRVRLFFNAFTWLECWLFSSSVLSTLQQITHILMWLGAGIFFVCGFIKWGKSLLWREGVRHWSLWFIGVARGCLLYHGLLSTLHSIPIVVNFFQGLYPKVEGIVSILCKWTITKGLEIIAKWTFSHQNTKHSSVFIYLGKISWSWASCMITRQWPSCHGAIWESRDHADLSVDLALTVGGKTVS